MPKKIASAVGENRKLFKDFNKDRARNYNKEKVDCQLKFNDVKLTPPDSPTLNNNSPDFTNKGLY